MKRIAVFILALTLILAMALPASAAGFSDVKGHWAQSYIATWADKGVINGYPDGTFRPDQQITRAEVTKILALAYEMETDVAKTNFTDVFENDWYYIFAQACAANGVVNGYPDGSFLPNNAIIRSEAVKMVCLAAGLTERESGVETENFKDVGSIPQWAVGYWNALYHAGVIDGYEDATLRPVQNITRAEFVKILCMAFSEVKIYELSVQIEDNLGNKVSDKASYLTGDSRVVETLIPMLIANRDTFDQVFPSHDMRLILDEGIAIAQAGYAGGWTESELAQWQKYIDDNFGSVQGDPSAIKYVSNVTSTINTMKMDVPYELKNYFDTEEGREDICYTVTITVSIMD